MDKLAKLQDIFRDVLDDESIMLTRETSPDKTGGWDSFAHINVVAACEAEFSVKFDLNDYPRIKTVGDLMDMIEGKL